MFSVLDEKREMDDGQYDYERVVLVNGYFVVALEPSIFGDVGLKYAPGHVVVEEVIESGVHLLM